MLAILVHSTLCDPACVSRIKENEVKKIRLLNFSTFFPTGVGYLTIDTLKGILLELEPKLEDDQLMEIVDEVDEDGSGTIDFDGIPNNICPYIFLKYLPSSSLAYSGFEFKSKFIHLALFYMKRLEDGTLHEWYAVQLARVTGTDLYSSNEVLQTTASASQQIELAYEDCNDPFLNI